MKAPKFSIIIPNLNGGQYIEEAILSVLEQDYPNYELIIMDGGSTDSSVEIIKKYEPQLTYWESTPDRGQAHAINKGIVKATGDLFDWLNSDDRIAPGTFGRVAKAFEANPETFVVCGKMTHFAGEHFHAPVRMKMFQKIEKSILFGSMSGPSMYFRLEKFKEVGPLDERLHFCFDLEYWCRFLERFGQGRLLFIDDNLSFFRLHSGSKSVNFLEKFSKDQFLIFRSILKSVRRKEIRTLSPEKLKTNLYYERQWHFPQLNPTIFEALFIQKTIERFHRRIGLTQLLQLYIKSLNLNPFNRGLAFYSLPIRALRWKLLGKLGLYKTWVSDFKPTSEN